MPRTEGRDPLASLGLKRGDPVGHLAPQDWMVAPETRAVIAALQADGVQARFVGG